MNETKTKKRPSAFTAKTLLKSKAQFIFITGPAGSGKSYLAREAMSLRPRFAVLTATTGVASRVLATDTVKVKTINSTLGYFDTTSLRNSRNRGTLLKNVTKIRKKYKRVIIDECSMLDAEQFEMIVAACEAVGLGLIIVGDFLQLPVIEPKPRPAGWEQWLFNTPSFAKFEVIRLTTQYRQTDPDFLDGLNLLRAGRGEEAIPHLKKAGVTFVAGGAKNPITHFNGTTICGTNPMKDAINNAQYTNLKTEEYTVVAKRHGLWQWEEDWKDIPASVSLKVGSRVMVLRNLYDEDTGELLQANGDTGVVEDVQEGFRFFVRRDDGVLIEVPVMETDNGKYHFEIGAYGKRTRIIDEEPTAWLNYMPLTQAWAMTTHKSQGLTLDHPTRIVCEDFFGRIAAMMYVACSRVKNPKHLTIVGADDQYNDHPWLHWLCKMDKQCVEYL